MAILYGRLRDLPVDAAPTIDVVRFTESGRFFFRRIALATSFTADCKGGLDDLTVDAAPTLLSAILQRFFFRRIALSTSLAADI